MFMGKQGEVIMENAGKAALLTGVVAVTILIQIMASRLRWTLVGLILPTLVFCGSAWILVQNIQYIRAGTASLDVLTAFSHFALYNIPTILFLCIYNYYQRRRLVRG